MHYIINEVLEINYLFENVEYTDIINLICWKQWLCSIVRTALSA